jgi:hypothetical protein
MDPQEFREFEVLLDEWLSQGYQIMADDIDGELCITAVFVPTPGEVGRERDQQFWPMLPEIVDLLESNGITISRAMSGP